MAQALPYITAGATAYGALKGSGDTQTSSVDPATQARYDDLYNMAKGVANQPFVPYTGPRVAGFNPDQLAGMDATRGLFGQSNYYNPQQGQQDLLNRSRMSPQVTPFTGTSTQLQPANLRQGTQLQPAVRQEASNIAPVDLYSGASINRGDIRDVKPQSLLSTDLNAYQNPFQSQVIDNTIGDLNRARQMQIQSDQDAAIGRGAFGGSRSALLESETNRNFADSVAKASGNLRSQGFDRATSLAGQDIGRQFDADRYMSGIDSNVANQNALFGQQSGLARQGLLGDVAQSQAQLDARRFGADQSALNQFGLQQAQFDNQRFGADQDALNRFGLQQGAYDNQMNMANMDAINRASQLNPSLEMQNRQFQQGLLNDQVGNQYRNLSLLGNQGRSAQALSQTGMDAGYNEFLRGINYGPQQLGLLSSAVFGMDPGRIQNYDQGSAGRIGSAVTSLDTLFGKDGIFG